MKIGEKVKYLRLKKGISLRELARNSGYSASFISQIERERTTPSLPSLENIAKALGFPLRVFFDEEDESVLDLDLGREQEPGLNLILYNLLQSKLALLKLFMENVGIVNSAENIAVNLGGNIDRVKFDLEDMVQARILKKLSTSDTTLYLFQPGPEITKLIQALVSKLEEAADET